MRKDNSNIVKNKTTTNHYPIYSLNHNLKYIFGVLYYILKSIFMKPDPSYQVATEALQIIDTILERLGLPRGGDLEEAIYTLIIILMAWSIGWLVKILVMFILNHTPRFKKSPSVMAMRGQRIFIVCSQVIPPIVFIVLIPFAFNSESTVLNIIIKIAVIFTIYKLVMAINSILDFMWHRYDEKDNVKNHPLKGILQISQGTVWLLGIIIVVSMLMDKSPVALLTGLGAFAAILMLVFKDSILGVVAGVQLSQNDMLRVGDWIVVPGTPANGNVIDVSLTVVKVQNWDNTIAMLPPYTLVSTSFQNWRGMSDSGVRRIARSYSIDVDSVQLSTPEMLEDFKEIPYMKEYITLKQQQAATGNVDNAEDKIGFTNGTIETNLGMLRAYMMMYLADNKGISHDPTSTLMVRILDPTPSGIPLQLYCFTSTTDWVKYEAIQSEIFEHFAAIMPRFGLYVFENPSGRDTVNQGFLEGGIRPNQVMGLPYQSIYNWAPGANKYPNPDAYKYWAKPMPRNDTFQTYPDNDAPATPTMPDSKANESGAAK